MSNASNFLSLLGRAVLTVAAQHAERSTSTLPPLGSLNHNPVPAQPVLTQRRVYVGKDWISDRRPFEGLASNILSEAVRKRLPAVEVNLFHSNADKFSRAMFFDGKDVVFEQYSLSDGRNTYAFSCDGILTSLTF